MSNLTKSGFPKEVKNLPEFLSELESRGADTKYINLHSNSEKGTERLHNLMWDAAQQGYISLNQVLFDGDTQFSAKLRLTALSYLENKRNAARTLRQGNMNTAINIIVLIVSILSILVTIYLHCNS